MKDYRTPFKFLDAFKLADRNAFFGRDKEVDTLYTLVFKTPLLLIYGMSGTGKTSLIQCGLASRFDGPDWLPLWIRRQGNINDALFNAVYNATPSDLRKPPSADNKPTDIIPQIQQLYRHYLRPVFLIFDQFEEIFVYGKPDERDVFIKELKNILESGLPCTVMLVIREDYLGKLYPFEKEIPTFFDFRMRVEPMDNTHVKTVLSKSFRRFNITEEPLAEDRYDEIINNVGMSKSGIELPYLQIYLDRLYREVFEHSYPDAETSNGNETWLPITVSKDDIVKLGEIKKVLDNFLEDMQSGIQNELKSRDVNVADDAVRAVLNGFVSEEGTTRPVRFSRDANAFIVLDNVDSGFFPKELAPNVLTYCLVALEKARIIRISDGIIELQHDILAALIDNKRTNEERLLNDYKRQIRAACQVFLSTEDYAMTQKQITLYEDVLPKLNLNEDEEKFFNDNKSKLLKAVDAERGKEKGRRNILAIIAALALIGMVVAVWFYFNARTATKKAEKSEKKALEKLHAAIDAQIQRETLEASGSERKIEIYGKSGDTFLIRYEQNRRDSFDNQIKYHRFELDSLNSAFKN